MTGIVSNRQALVEVELVGAGGAVYIRVTFVLDTGFTGVITLPPAIIARVAARYKHRISAQLADGSTTFTAVYDVTIVWNGQEVDVEAVAVAGHPLIGTGLLDGHEVVIQFADGGTVTIDTL